MTTPVIGIVGGGQLGRMFIEEALRYNVKCVILDADENAPAALVADQHILGSITDRDALHKLAANCDVMTYEIEHIFTEALEEMQASGKTVIPSANVLNIIQDKGKQKDFYRQHGIATSDYVIVNSPNEWLKAVAEKGWEKFAAKSCKEGYDGKGVSLMSTKALQENPNNVPFENETVLEQFIPNAKELAVIVAVDQKGNTATYPAVEMEFDPEANLVKYLFCPANISEQQASDAEALALKTVKAFGSAGLYAVEMFLDAAGKLFVNEVAPRPHNSGHHTIEACYTSQYEQLLRILMGFPLGSTKLIKPAAMINVLGDKNFSGPYRIRHHEKLLAMPGVYIHMYGKKTSKPMRKLGHVTVLSDDARQLRMKVEAMLPLIGVEPA
jgi:5-(carboxyamino)imidazole ribonucleotide synthase